MKAKVFFAMPFVFLCLFVPSSMFGQNKKQKQTEPPSPPVAKSGPSFEATRDWMVSTLSQYGGTFDDGAIQYVYTNVRINNSCMLTFQVEQFQDDYKAGSRPFESWIVTIPIGAVTDAALQQYQGAYWLALKTGKISAVTKTHNINYGWSKLDDSDTSSSGADLDVGRAPRSVAGQPEPASIPDMASRFTVAFQHMMEVCKGTYQAPVNPNQPF